MTADNKRKPAVAQSSNLLINLARGMRRQQTDAERKLWAALRDRQITGTKFRRQVPIGPYVVDFVSREKRVVVELDGGQHASQREADNERTAFLESRGYRVVRFWDNEVLCETRAVLEQISKAVSDPHPTLSLQGEGLLDPWADAQATLSSAP